MNTFTVVVSLDATDWAGTPKKPIYRCPTAAYGGAVTLVAAEASVQNTTSGGNTFSLDLQNGGTDASGTTSIVSATIGGSSSEWAANTPKSWTISDGELEAGEYLMLVKTEEGTGDDPLLGSVILTFVQGN